MMARIDGIIPGIIRRHPGKMKKGRTKDKFGIRTCIKAGLDKANVAGSTPFFPRIILYLRMAKNKRAKHLGH